VFEHLLSPVSPLRVGRFALPNRVLITAHATKYVDGNGLPVERAVHYYAERARGGAGLMVTGASSVHPSSPRVSGATSRRLHQGRADTRRHRHGGLGAPGCVVADLVEPLRAAGLPVHAVGDCVAPRRMEHAVHEAHAVARVL
jgi:hypothetical protein